MRLCYRSEMEACCPQCNCEYDVQAGYQMGGNEGMVIEGVSVDMCKSRCCSDESCTGFDHNDGTRTCLMYAEEIVIAELVTSSGWTNYAKLDSLSDDVQRTYWTADTAPYNITRNRVQVLADALYRPVSISRTTIGVTGNKVVMNRNDDGSSTSINIFESIIVSGFLIIGAGQLLAAIWKYTGNEQTDRMFEQQVLTGVKPAIIWAANFLWDFVLCLIVGAIYLAIASGEKDTVTDCFRAWSMSCVGFLWMTYALGLTLDRETLNTVLTTVSFVSYVVAGQLINVDEFYLAKIIDIDYLHGMSFRMRVFGTKAISTNQLTWVLRLIFLAKPGFAIVIHSIIWSSLPLLERV
eukprot:TRINITY_DN1885_c0_g1_i1.p1 TRINITY_DN1885_c0_g1~~TRINITY_DN1885_c0_g1_i1.p1  ORF type:complete len:351 (-),score=45.79 TRINITY_DN1885_c0_g1_i1:31-1083(-)